MLKVEFGPRFFRFVDLRVYSVWQTCCGLVRWTPRGWQSYILGSQLCSHLLPFIDLRGFDWQASGMQCEAVQDHIDAVADARSTRDGDWGRGLDGPLFGNCTVTMTGTARQYQLNVSAKLCRSTEAWLRHTACWFSKSIMAFWHSIEALAYRCYLLSVLRQLLCSRFTSGVTAAKHALTCI